MIGLIGLFSFMLPIGPTLGDFTQMSVKVSLFLLLFLSEEGQPQ